jgi:geranylgeranyl pyrophosphate synthase
MDIEAYLQEKSKLINHVIEKWVPRKYDKKSLERVLGLPRFAYNIDAPNKAIAEPVWDLLDRGGKRWRPVLMLLVCEALEGEAGKFLDWFIIPELIHNGTLVVDDVEDDSKLRRGKPCLHKIYGVDIAVNAGNAMYYLPLQVLSDSNGKVPDFVLLKAYEIYAQEMTNLSFGQAMDIAWHKGLAYADKLTEVQYLQMCAYKTGTLARMAAKLGALISGADDVTIEKIGRLGESIGIAFQIQDDVLNLTATSDKNQFVKGYVGEDIHEGKRTLMVIHTLNHASERDRSRLLDILEMHTRDRKLIQEAMDIMNRYKAIDYARDCARKLVLEAWQDVDAIFKPSQSKNAIRALVEFAAKRQY